MEVLFVILKIIAVLFAILLLFCIALVLVPVRYRVSLNVQEEIEGKAVIHWLFHLVDMRIYYKEKKVSYKLRIFGIALPLDKKKESRQADPGRIKKRKKDKNIPDKPEDFEITGQEREDSLGKEPIREEISLEKKETFIEEKKPQEKEMLNSEEKVSSKKKKRRKKEGFFHKIKSRFYNLKQKSRTVSQNIQQRAEDMKNGTTTLKEQIKNIKGMISEETNQEAFFHVWRELRYLLRHYMPGTISGNVTFSMGNPEQTGKILGAASLLPFWARSRMVVMPDFHSESFYVKGILFVTGHIRLLHLPAAGIRLVTDKNIRKLIANIRG